MTQKDKHQFDGKEVKTKSHLVVRMAASQGRTGELAKSSRVVT